MIILHRIGSWVTEFADYYAKANTVAALSQLSDRQLQDIGISRGQLNVGVEELWADQQQTKTATAKTQHKPAAVKQDSSLSDYLASLYSTRNRPGYMV